MLRVQQALIPKQQPNLSIKPQQINENPQHSFDCQCMICKQYPFNQVTKMISQNQKHLESKVNQIVQTKNLVTSEFYQWVLKKLMIPHNKIVLRGVQIFIPQTCFYKDGQVTEMFLNRQLNDHHIKSIHKQKINNMLLQRLFNQRRRKYRQIIAPLYKKNIVKKNLLYGVKKQVKIDTKDAIIIRQNDGYEKLISENQFINILLKRKQDPFWKTIEYIKNYMQICGKNIYSGLFKYVYNDIKYKNLYKRAKIIMKIYSLNIQSGHSYYISQKQEAEFTKQLKQNSKQAFCNYMLYQIVQFIQVFHDQKIYKLNAKLLVNEIGQCFLLQVYKLEKKEDKNLIKYNWTNEVYNKKLADQEHQKFYTKKVKVTTQTQHNVSLIENQMFDEYEKMKIMYGLSMQQKDNTEQIANNNFFRKLHSNFQDNISQILMDKQIGVNKFKKVYLGFKPKKKPIVKPFNSNMLKTLNSMTPNLRASLSNGYTDFLKERRYSGMKRNSTIDSKKRAFTPTTSLATPLRTINML